MNAFNDGTTLLTQALAGNETAKRALYLDYVNSFISLTGFAVHYGLDIETARGYLHEWRELHEKHCARLKESLG